MACALIHRCPYYPHPEPAERSDNIIRLSIFLFYSGCAGVAALVWALTVLPHHHEHNDRIPASVIVVLLNDMLEILLKPYIITKLIQGDCQWDTDMPCRILFSLWGASIICGVHLQQMMVFESVLTVIHPSCFAHVFFPPCSSIFSIIAFICFLLFEYYFPPLMLLIVILQIAVTVTSWILVCRKPPAENSSNRTKKPDYTLIAFATLTLIIYLLFLILYIFSELPLYITWNLVMMCLCLLSLRVIVDPLLCVLVCKQKHTQSDKYPAVGAEKSVEIETVLRIS